MTPTVTQSILIEHNGIIYETTFSSSVIGMVQKTYPDSGIEDSVLFDSLPKGVQEKILKQILNDDDED